MTNREVLLTPNLSEEQTWVDLANIIDETWEYNIDNPLKLLPTLRDTYSYTDLIFQDSNEDVTKYIEETPIFISGSTFQTKNINLLDSNYTYQIVLIDTIIPTYLSNNNLPTSTILKRGNGVSQYNVNTFNSFTLGRELSSTETLLVIAYAKSVFDVSDLVSYGNADNQEGTFVLTFPTNSLLNITTDINLDTGLPANLSTGFPYNLLIVYLQIEDGSFQYLPPSSYKLIDTQTIQFLSLPYNPLDSTNLPNYLPSYFKIVQRQPAVEVTKKLNQLGFLYGDIEYITRPSYVPNAHITQAMADNYSAYIFSTAGTLGFMDFFQYCSNSNFEIYKLWAQDNGNLSIYDNITRQTLLPYNYNKVYEVAAGSGGWYPTSHVDLFYDIFTYGSQLDINEVTKFFNYVAPINLVLNSVVFGGNVPVSESSTIHIGGSAEVRIIYY